MSSMRYAREYPSRYGGIQVQDQTLDFYAEVLRDHVGCCIEVGRLVGRYVLDIRPYASYLGWCFDGRNLYGIHIGTQIVIAVGIWSGYSGIVS